MKDYTFLINSQRIRSWFFAVLLAFGMTGVLNAQSVCVQGSAAAGFDWDPVSVTVIPTCQGPGIITSVTMDASIGSSCNFGWYNYSITVNGTTIAYNQCDQTGYDLTPYLPITSVTLESQDWNFIPNPITLSCTLNITYNANFCSGTPTAGATVASTPIACDGDSIDLTLSNQSSEIGLSYQWQSSSDNSTWTNMVNDTLLSVTTTQNSTTYYRCEVTCDISGLTSISTVDSVLQGFCTPFSDTVCSGNPGPTSESITITGWQGLPVSDGILTFRYSGQLLLGYDSLFVHDAAGNYYGHLDGNTLSCSDNEGELPLTLSQINNLLSVGNGNIELIITSTSQVYAWCNNLTYSFCIQGSLRAVRLVYANDAMAQQLVTPALNQCVLDSTVSFELYNSGLNNLTSAQLNWSVNGVVQPPVSWTGNILPNTSDTVTIGVYPGGFTNMDSLAIWPSMPNGGIDSNTVSDTLIRMVSSALSGTYIVSAASGSDFVDFNSAIQALEDFGMCGPVVLMGADTLYVEQLSINTSLIGGISDTNTLTFTSQSGNPEDVKIRFFANGNSDNYVVKLENSQYVTFSNLTLLSTNPNYGKVLFTPLGGNNHHITISGCVIEGVWTLNPSYPQDLFEVRGVDNNYWTIENNTFLNGNSALFFGNNNYYHFGNSVVGNSFINQSGNSVYFFRQTDFIVKDNYFTSTTNIATNGNSTAIAILNANGTGEISGNHIQGTNTWPNRDGMSLSNIVGNPTNPYKIYNNRVHVIANQSWKGVMLSDVSNVDFVFNSIYKHAFAASGGSLNYNYGFVVNNCDSLRINNNIIQLSGQGYALSYSGNSHIISDYNNVSVMNNIPLPISNFGKYDGVNTYAYSNWVSQSSLDSNSLIADSIFSDYAELRVCNDTLYAAGISLSSYTHDYEGDPRQSPPCIGADEFLPIQDFTLGGDVELCDGDTLTFTVPYYDVVVWDYVDTTSVISFTNPGSHFVSVYDICGSDTASINVIAQLYVDLTDTNLCEGTSAILQTGISNGTYTWSTGSTDSSITVDSAQVVYVSVVSADGCFSSDTATITQSQNVDLGQDTVSFCEGENVVLNANMAGSYAWSNGSSNQSINVTSPGVYSVTVTQLNCVSEDTTTVNEILNPIPSFTESISQNTVTFTNTSQYADSYFWDFGDGNTSVVTNPTHTYSPGTSIWNYSVTLKATNSCTEEEFQKEVTNKPNGISNLVVSNGIKLYPNPSDGFFQVECNLTTPMEMSVQVVDTKGALVYMSSFGMVEGEVNRRIHLENVSQGIYFVKVSLNGETAVFHLSVQ